MIFVLHGQQVRRWIAIFSLNIKHDCSAAVHYRKFALALLSYAALGLLLKKGDNKNVIQIVIFRLFRFNIAVFVGDTNLQRLHNLHDNGNHFWSSKEMLYIYIYIYIYLVKVANLAVECSMPYKQNVV